MVSLNVEPKIALPPLIFLKLLHVTFTVLCTKLIELIGVENFHCKALADRLKIMTINPDSYRTLVCFLREEKSEFYTYQLKEDKPTRVVFRNLHSTTLLELIKSELEQRLFDICSWICGWYGSYISTRGPTHCLFQSSKPPWPNICLVWKMESSSQPIKIHLHYVNSSSPSLSINLP